MLNNRPPAWDREVDFVSIGSGIAGLGAAIAAAELGGKALVLERADKVGGVTALSMGEVWIAGNHHAEAAGIADSPESGFRYIQRLSMGYADDAAILNLVTNAPAALAWFEQRIGLGMKVIRDCPDYYYGHSNDAVAQGRMLEVEPFDAQALGEWRERTRVSPLMPYGLTHDEMLDWGGTSNIANWDFQVMGDRLVKDERCLGPGLAATFVKGALDRNVPMLTGANVIGLYGDGERVVGVRVEYEGGILNVGARRGVLVSVSSHERHPEYNRTLGNQLDIGSMVFSTIDGANFRLTGPFGARVARVPDITLVGFTIPGEEDEEGHPLWRSALQPIGQPHIIVVNAAGKRFSNEAFYRQFCYDIARIDGGTQSHPNFPCWAISDAQARAKYPFGGVMPGQDFPEGVGVKADSIAELARLIGIDPQALEETVARFNANAERGIDPDFGRGTHPWSAWMSGDPRQQPNPNLGALVKAPYHAVPLKRMGGSGIPATGILADRHGRVLGWDDAPIPGLYVAGNSMARMETGAMMQSGISNARGMTYGWLAARHAMGNPSTLLDLALAQRE